ncbi:MAG: DUF4153 domain-containing protein [Synergistaceae bacterium]|nr:DUF4153 domain-containing protein [Synergistaceae bacterium]
MMYSIDRKRYLWVTVSALLQGLLLGAYAVVRLGVVETPNRLLLCMPISLVVIVPFVFWLAQEHWGRRLTRFILCLSLILAFFYLYRLWSVYPFHGSFSVVPSQRQDLIRACMAVFLLIPFFQCRIATWSWRMPYSEIFFQLCRNLFLLFQAVIVVGVFGGLLLTASLLFAIVGLHAVPMFLFNPLVAMPLTSLTVAISISVALKHPGIDSLGRWILSVLAWILPPFSLLSIVFIACLPWSGLRTLWSTGQASSLMLLLQFGTILLTNAAWLDGTRSPFPNRFVNALAQMSLLCLPIYTALCLYSLGLRIQQYGLSVDRIHAAFMAIVTGVWGIGYAGAVILRRWPSSIGRINIVSALILTLLVALMNSPVLDPYRLAANNQVDRLLAGRIAPEDFDYLYMRFSLGRYGNYALTRIGESGHPRAEAIQKRIAAAMSVSLEEYRRDLEDDVVPVPQRREILRHARVYPGDRSLPQPLVDYLIQDWDEERSPLRGVRRSSELAFVFKNFTREDEPGEEVLLFLEGKGMALKVEGDTARAVGVFSGQDGQPSPQSLRSTEVSAVESRFMDLQIGGKRYQILPPPQRWRRKTR